MKRKLMHLSAALFVVLVSCCALTSCKDDEVPEVTWPEWGDVSTPQIASASLKPASGSASEVTAGTAGAAVRFRAHITDASNQVRVVKVTVKVGGNEIVSGQFRFTSNEADVDFPFTIPFVPGIAADTYPEVTFEAINSLHKSVSATLENAQNVLVKRPAMADKVYLVTDTGAVYELSKGADDVYAADVKINYFASYKIAEKLTGANKIDYNSHVWGLVDGGPAIITSEAAAGIPSAINPAAVVKKISFNAVSFVTTLDLAVVFGGKELTASSYNGYQEVALSLIKDQTYTVTGIGGLSGAINPNFFEPVSESEVKFTGLSDTYTLYYHIAKSRLYVEQPGARYPDALWLSGMGTGFPQQPYGSEIDWSQNGWNWTVDVQQRTFCKKIGDKQFETIIYMPAGGFNIKVMQQCGWGNEFQSWEFTKTPENMLVDGIEPTDGHQTGDLVAGSALTAGVYLIRIDLNDKTLRVIPR